ncbi:MAG TPA: hypothetical protein EYH12_01145 [Psychromonas hadalis]|nr:hypothetical protein [Psychromonas hadalis]
MVTRPLIPLASQTQLVERLQHLVYLGSSSMVVFGEKGSGKSTLIELLANSLSDEVLCHFVSLTKSSCDDKIKEQLLSTHFKTPLFNPQDPLLNSFFLLQGNKIIKQNRVIVIDDAHLISDAFLKEVQSLIHNKQQISTGELSILFFSNKDKLPALDGFVRDMQSEEFEVNVLSDNESHPLLLNTCEKLDSRAKKHGQSIEKEALQDRLGNASKIVELVPPSAVKSVQSETVKSVHQKKKKQVSIAKVFALGVFAIIAGIGAYFYPQFMQATKTEKIAPKIVEPKITEKVKEVEKTKEIIEEEQLAGEWSSEPVEASSEGSENEARENAYRDEDAQLVIEQFVTQTPEDNKLLTAEPVVEVAEVKTPSLITSNEKILAIPATKYALQLASISSKRSFLQFVTRYKLPQPDVYVYQTLRKGTLWDIIIFGKFTTFSQAKKAISSLAPIFKDRKPWVKKYKAIHQELNVKAGKK